MNIPLSGYIVRYALSRVHVTADACMRVLLIWNARVAKAGLKALKHDDLFKES